MKRIFLVLLFLFFPLVIFAAENQEKVAVLPAEEADVDSWDFGKVDALGNVVKHTFIFKNETDKIMQIKDVTSSCSCAVPRIKDKSLLPAETTPIEVWFNPAGYVGPVTQYIYVSTDNIDKSIFRFSIKAQVSMEQKKKKNELTTID